MCCLRVVSLISLEEATVLVTMVVMVKLMVMVVVTLLGVFLIVATKQRE